jgi:hypothetical protein
MLFPANGLAHVSPGVNERSERLAVDRVMVEVCQLALGELRGAVSERAQKLPGDAD